MEAPGAGADGEGHHLGNGHDGDRRYGGQDEDSPRHHRPRDAPVCLAEEHPGQGLGHAAEGADRRDREVRQAESHPHGQRERVHIQALPARPPDPGDTPPPDAGPLPLGEREDREVLRDVQGIRGPRRLPSAEDPGGARRVPLLVRRGQAPPPSRREDPGRGLGRDGPLREASNRSKGSLPLGRAAEGIPVQLQIKYCFPNGDAVRRPQDLAATKQECSFSATKKSLSWGRWKSLSQKGRGRGTRLDDDCAQSTPAGSGCIFGATSCLRKRSLRAGVSARAGHHPSRDAEASCRKQKIRTNDSWQPKDRFFHPCKEGNLKIRISRSSGRSKGSLTLGRAAEGVPVQLQIKYLAPDGDAVRRPQDLAARKQESSISAMKKHLSWGRRKSFSQKGQRTGQRGNSSCIYFFP